MGKVVNVEISLKDVRGNTDRLIKRFIKKVKKEKIIDKVREKMFYEKPSAKRRREKIKKKENARKAQKERKQLVNRNRRK